MSLLDTFFGTDDALAQGRALDAKREALVIPQYQPGGVSYEKIKASGRDADAVSASVMDDFFGSRADALDAKGNAIYDADHESDSGIGKLIKDLIVLAVVGAAIWAFVNFGGMAAVKRLASKAKWAPWAIAGAVLVGAWFIYSRVKQTGEDAGNFGSNLGKSFKSIIGLN
jgi:hypothetical protein